MSEKQENTAEVIQDDVKSHPDLPLKYEAFKLMRENGFNKSDAAKSIGLTRSSGVVIEKKINRIDDLTSRKSVKLASKAHKLILNHFTDPEHNPLESKVEIKGSDVSKAIDRVYDRAQPVRRDGAGSGPSISFIQINLGGQR